MILKRQPKLGVLLITLLFLAGLPALAEARGGGGGAGGEGAIAAFVILAVATYATTMTVICTPVAAFKRSDHPEGFTGAFGDCVFWRASRTTAAATEQNKTAESKEPVGPQVDQSSQRSTDPALEETRTEAPAL